MCEQMRQYGTLSEIHQRALLIAMSASTGHAGVPQILKARVRGDWDILEDTPPQTN
jgi:hypothetical protein